MRIKEDIVELDYGKVKIFFGKRSKKYNEQNPYGVTMYQDNDQELVEKRNQNEVQKILPLLQLEEEMILLDVACGVGRWADNVEKEIKKYYGVDFSQELIEIARERLPNKKYDFQVASTIEIIDCFNRNAWEKCDRIILAGILMYLNDPELQQLLKDLKEVSQRKTKIYVRESIGVDYRLTLKDFHSEELQEEYNVVYRTRDLYAKVFIENGYKIESEGNLFEQDDLNNRNETRQYYFILNA